MFEETEVNLTCKGPLRATLFDTHCCKGEVAHICLALSVETEFSIGLSIGEILKILDNGFGAPAAIVRAYRKAVEFEKYLNRQLPGPLEKGCPKPDFDIDFKACITACAVFFTIEYCEGNPSVEFKRGLCGGPELSISAELGAKKCF